jgi:hypothetical protein
MGSRVSFGLTIKDSRHKRPNAAQRVFSDAGAPALYPRFGRGELTARAVPPWDLNTGTNTSR